jgi:glycosyltransferase involved in cell wall biosynthesis
MATAITHLRVSDNSPKTLANEIVVVEYNVGDGGSAYEAMVAESLANAFTLLRHALDFRRWGSLKHVAAPIEFARARRFLMNCPEGSVVVKTFLAALLNSRRQPSSIVILHHFGESDNWLYSLLEPYMLGQLRTANAVVVVSKYWENFLLKQGLTNVHTIYNAFRVKEFEFAAEEIESFTRRFNLLGKPIIYMGNYGADKGVDETFEALKDLDVHLIASGHAGTKHNPVKCCFLERRDYLRLLASSTLAVSMSQAAEGWCRSAHEAMLCGTPVLGSGLGGMEELLVSGGQVICRDFQSLRACVKELLGNKDRRAKLKRKGREFAAQFTQERFQREWIALVNEVRIASAPKH